MASHGSAVRALMGPAVFGWERKGSERFDMAGTDSILQTEKICYVTGSCGDLDKHHVYHGPRRKAADKWGCWVWLRHDVHMNLHDRDKELDRRLQRECQEAFEEKYDHETFMKVFGKNYL